MKVQLIRCSPINIGASVGEYTNLDDHHTVVVVYLIFNFLSGEYNDSIK